jgi:GT2 family glycosyltransferase
VRVSESISPIAVAIATLDRPEALERCLRSLAGGSTLPAEVVVVDQAPERTAKPIVAGAERLPAVRYMHDQGMGLGRGQNLAVRAGTQAAVAVLDDDCVADAQWVETAHRLLDSDGLELVGGRVLPLPDSRPGVVPVSSRTSEHRLEFRGRTAPWDVGSGNNFAFRREWFERIGGCDERLGPGSPGRGGLDMDLFYRLLRAGARGRYEPDLVVYHEQKNPEGRLVRRGSYGFGMAAACALWLREGRDRYALRVFGEWLVLRGRRLAAAVHHGRWRAAYEELLVLGGTALGVVHGLRVARRSA